MYFDIKYVLDSDDYNEMEELAEISQIMGFDVSNNSSFFNWLFKDNYFEAVVSSSDGFNAPYEAVNEVLDYPIILSAFRSEYGISERDFWQLSVPEYKRLLLGLQFTKNALSKLVENRTIKTDTKDDAKTKEAKSILRETYAIKSTNKTRDRMELSIAKDVERKMKIKELLGGEKGGNILNGF